MSRSLRLEFPGALWHVLNRGVERRAIFLDDDDRKTFLQLLSEVVARYHWRVHAFVLMTNHFHIFLETVEPTLSRGMRKLTGDYASHFNWRHGRVGHLVQGRFRSHLVDSDGYFLEVARYIVLNPVRARMVATAADYRWSSYRATARLDPVPAWLTTEEVLRRLDPYDDDRAAADYTRFVAARLGDATSPWDHLVGQIYLGGEGFIERVQRRLHERLPLSTEHPRPQRIPRVAALEDVRREVLPPDQFRSKRHRAAFAVLAREEALATLGQIGATLEITPSGASYLMQTARDRISSDPALSTLIEELRLRIRNC